MFIVNYPPFFYGYPSSHHELKSILCWTLILSEGGNITKMGSEVSIGSVHHFFGSQN